MMAAANWFTRPRRGERRLRTRDPLQISRRFQMPSTHHRLAHPHPHAHAHPIVLVRILVRIVLTYCTCRSNGLLQPRPPLSGPASLSVTDDPRAASVPSQPTGGRVNLDPSWILQSPIHWVPSLNLDLLSPLLLAAVLQPCSACRYFCFATQSPPLYFNNKKRKRKNRYCGEPAGMLD